MGHPVLRLFDGSDSTSPELSGEVKELQTLLKAHGFSLDVDVCSGLTQRAHLSVSRLSRGSPTMALWVRLLGQFWQGLGSSASSRGRIQLRAGKCASRDSRRPRYRFLYCRSELFEGCIEPSRLVSAKGMVMRIAGDRYFLSASVCGIGWLRAKDLSPA